MHSTGAFFDLDADPLEQHSLAASTHAEHVAARQRLQAVIDGFAPNAPQGFVPRSISARRLGIGIDEQRADDARLAPAGDTTEP